MTVFFSMCFFYVFSCAETFKKPGILFSFHNDCRTKVNFHFGEQLVILTHKTYLGVIQIVRRFQNDIFIGSLLMCHTFSFFPIPLLLYHSLKRDKP